MVVNIRQIHPVRNKKNVQHHEAMNTANLLLYYFLNKATMQYKSFKRLQ